MPPFGGAGPSSWASGAGRPCRGRLAGGCSAHHGWSDKLGHGQGVTSRGIHAAWHTTALCVSPLRQWMLRSRAAASCQVMSLRARLRPHLSPACAPHFLSTSCDPLGSGSTLRPYPTSTPVFLVELGHSPRIDTALREEQRQFPPGPTGFRPCLCPHRTLFLCCRCAECKLVGASKARCSGRCPLPHRCPRTWPEIPGSGSRRSLDVYSRTGP